MFDFRTDVGYHWDRKEQLMATGMHTAIKGFNNVDEAVEDMVERLKEIWGQRHKPRVQQ
jgi:hypothetical protein